MDDGTMAETTGVIPSYCRHYDSLYDNRIQSLKLTSLGFKDHKKLVGLKSTNYNGVPITFGVATCHGPA
jgi:hypothetical protein